MKSPINHSVHQNYDQQAKKTKSLHSLSVSLSQPTHMNIGDKREKYVILYMPTIVCSFQVVAVLLIYLQSSSGQDQVATCYYQSNQSKAEAIPLSALPKDTTSELAGLSSHYHILTLNIKQESCEYQLFKVL